MAFGRLGAAGTGFGRLGSSGSGGGVAAPAGGAALLVGETNGFATDFTHAVNAERVAVKTAGTVVSSGTSFFTSGGTSSKWVYNSAGTLVNIPVGTLALDYDPGTLAARGLLVEPAATNLQTNSNDLSATVTVEGGAVTVNNQTGPDGALTADTYTENTATINHGCYGSIAVVANTDYTFSRFMKMGTRRYASLGWTDGTNGAYAVYDLQSGVVGSSAAIGTGTRNSASIQACPNGWYRCVLSGKFPTGTNAYYTQQAANAATITPDGFGRQVFLGTGATLFMGHVQIETGTIATSPIPTSGVAATRAADNISFLLSTIPALGAAYSMYGRFSAPIVNSTRYVYILSDGTTNEFAGIQSNTTAALNVVDGGVSQTAIALGTIVANTSISSAARIQANNFGHSVAGSAVTTDVAGTLPTLTQMRFGGTASTGALATFRIEKLILVTDRGWSDAELAAKSAT